MSDLKTTLMLGTYQGALHSIQTSNEIEDVFKELGKFAEHYSYGGRFYVFRKSKEVYYVMFDEEDIEEKRALKKMLSEATGLGMRVDELSTEQITEFLAVSNGNDLEARAEE